MVSYLTAAAEAGEDSILHAPITQFPHSPWTDGDVYLHDGVFSVSKLMEIAIYFDFLERDLFKPPVINFRHAVEPHIFTQGKQRAKHDSVNLRIRVIH